VTAGQDKQAILTRDRRRALAAILAEFEEAIEPLIPTGHLGEIDRFKGVVRKKLNGIVWKAIQLEQLESGQELNEYATQLAEDHLIFEDD
jgi:hypothetical protein